MASIAESESAIAEGRTFGLEDIRADDRWRAAAAMRPRPLSWTWTAATGTVATLAKPSVIASCLLASRMDSPREPMRA